MILKDLTVEGVGRFLSAAYINGFEPGVNVLAAGNEAGKSTLFRAIRTCLFSRHDSKSQEVKDLGSDDSQLPATIQLTFLHDGRTYVIKKSFLRSPVAVLIEDGREIARSKQADEAVWDVLGLTPGSGRTLDDGAFGVLWVGQGASTGRPIPGPGASLALNSAIESEVGALIGGERARQTLEEIGVELKRYVTESDRPKSDGPLQHAIGEVERWQVVEREAQSKFAALEQQFVALLKLRLRRQESTDVAKVEQLAKELVEARESLAAAQSSAQELRRFEAEEQGAKRALESATERLNQLRELTSRIDLNRQSEGALTRGLLEQQAREQEARAALARTQEQIASVEKQVQSLLTRERQLEKLTAASHRAIQKDDLARKLKALERADKVLLQIDAQLAQLVIKPKAVDALDDLDRQVASLDAQLSATAAHLVVEVKPSGAGLVRIGSARPKGTFNAAVVASTKITVGELATITVTPAPNSRSEKRQSVDAERSSLLQSIGVASVAEAHALLSKRRELEADRKGVLVELKTLKVSGEAAPVIARAKSELAETDAAIAAALIDTRRTSLPTTNEIEEEALDLGQQRTGLDARRASLEETRELQQEALERAVEARSGTESELGLVRRIIEEDVALCPDSERLSRDTAFVANVTNSERSHAAAATLLAVKRQATLGTTEIERREARLHRLERAHENRNNELFVLEREIGVLNGQIQTAGGDGIGEVWAVAQDERARADRDRSRIEERIAILRMLQNTISTCLSEGRDHYYEPVRRHLRPYLNDLFPGAELSLGDDFAITGIRRDRPELFTRLSAGTQEQIAVLVRLAMGAMLAERGKAVPIILDDALVYCDDDRLGLMFDALSRAGKCQQVIVLTCRIRTFAPLGGHMLRVQGPSN